MSSDHLNDGSLTRAQWETVLGDVTPASYGEVLTKLEDADLVDAEPRDLLDDALADGPLIESDTTRFGEIQLAADAAADVDTEADAGEANPDDGNPGGDSKRTALEAPAIVENWRDADVADVEAQTWAPAQMQTGAWMARKDDQKVPVAPWADPDAPVACNRPEHKTATTAAECTHSARYKWGSDGSHEYVHADFETAHEWTETDPRLSSDLVFIQRESDPFAFVDGDDVRDPETGELHPVFRAFLEHLGVTYADVSTSGSGVHAIYRGDIPLEGVTQAVFDLDTEPWGANDDTPSLEIYSGKHVCVATGEHVVGTGTEVTAWDEDALAAILTANGFEEKPEPSATADFDLADHTPSATGADETTGDVRDLFSALNRLDARRVAADTIVAEWNDDANTSGDNRAFVPTWGRNANGTANIVNGEIWQDTGGNGYGGVDVMAAIACPDLPQYDERSQPRDLQGADWFRAVDYLRDELGYVIPEYDAAQDDENTEASGRETRDFREVDVVVEPRNALTAARAVTPDDLSDPESLPEFTRDDVDDVAIAVALHEGWIASPDEFPSDGRYTDAYYQARDHYGAPLPKYLDNTALEERADLAIAAANRVTPAHILANVRSEVTVTDPSGAATAKLDPTWEDSESGERIIAGYGRGFWCTEHSPGRPSGGQTFDALQLVALEHGLVEDEFTQLSGEAYKQAYRLLREEYGAPIPKWRATILEHRAVLPPAVRLLDDAHRATAAESLDEARAETEALVRDAVTVSGRGQLLTPAPGTGKTYSTAVVADETPILYLASRNELKAQMADYADEICEDDDTHPDAEPTYAHLPIFAETPPAEGAIHAGVAAVREHGLSLLRDREALLDHVEDHLPDDEDEDEYSQSIAADPGEEDDDYVELNRATCPTAEGTHDEEWQVAVHVARELGLRPATIHRNAETLFGAPLPCSRDSDCAYKQGWDDLRDPDNPIDILIGAPGHAFVDTATTYFERRGDERVARPRAVVIDEFPGDTYTNAYGGRFMDHAVWLANALCGVDTREDLTGGGLGEDTWVDLWLEGDGTEYAPAADAHAIFTAVSAFAAAADDARDLRTGTLLDDVGAATTVDTEPLDGALATLIDATPGDAIHDVQATIRDVRDDVEVRADYRYGNGQDAGSLYALADRLEDILGNLAEATAGLDDRDPLTAAREAAEALPVGGDLAALLEDAIDAVGTERATPLLEDALTALEGGRDGCRALAIHAEDGYAHPKAWVLLAGAIADPEHGDATEVEEATFSFDSESEGGSFKRRTVNDVTIAVDKNHKGALGVETPAFTDITGAKCPVLGLDATGRTPLWRLAIGRDTQRRDIHETAAERRRFLRETMQLTVVQTTDRPLPYHGNPQGKNFQEDLELVRTVATEYTGTGSGAFDDKGPAVISTKKVLAHLKDDLTDVADETVNYEGMKGSDALGDHQVAVILGSQHYGDAAVEKWALLAGEDAGRGDTRGPTLDYDSEVANAYLYHMREDHTMQAILRAGRNADASVVFAHTSALHDDLPVENEAAVVSAHSKGTLAVLEAARELRGEPFTAQDIANTIADQADTVGLRQVQNVLADLRESGSLRVETDGTRGRAYEYELGDEEAGVADVDLPDLEAATAGKENEIPRTERAYTWDFVMEHGEDAGTGVTPSSRATIPVNQVADPAAPPG